mgnify:CR=1 FL=1
MPENIRAQYQYYSKANIEKLRNAGYENKILNLEDSIEDYVKNYLVTGNYLMI